MHIPIETGHWERGEFDAVLRNLFGHQISGRAIELLTAEGSDLFGGKHVFALNSGRGAMALALRIMARRMPGRRRVFIPEYICPAVPETLQSHGLEPVGVAVGPDLNMRADDVVNALDSSVLAVIPVHMYGCVMSLRKLAEATAATGVGMIDDAAHLIGVVGEGGEIPGTSGPFGFTSFAQSKSVACGHPGAGGLLVVSDNAYLADVEHAYAELPAPRAPDLFNYMLMGRRLAAKPSPLWRFERAWARQAKTPSLETNLTKIANAHAAIALVQLQSLHARIADKKRVLEAYNEALALPPGVFLPQYAHGKYLTRVMLAVRNISERDALRRYLADRGVASRRGYPAPSIKRLDGTRPLELPLLELPGGYGLPQAAIMHVGRMISEFFGARGRAQAS
jgi:dTDP-4-amino-4,6-dideoxygalactose transaminase